MEFQAHPDPEGRDFVDVEMARTVVAAWPDMAHRLAERFWPGPLTLVLTK